MREKTQMFFLVFFLFFRVVYGAPCKGEFSSCPDGSCALVVQTECGRCSGATPYACPLNGGCFDGNNFLLSCAGLKGTHFDTSLGVEARLDYIFSTAWTVAEYTGQMTENATYIPRLSIPQYSYLNDDQHGVKQPDATAFPNGASMGATWDRDLLTQIGLAIGTEARGIHNTLDDKSGETGGHTWPGTIRNGVGLTMYAPNVNLVHDPRWGRANEVMSECPYLSGELVAAYVTGLQNSTEETAKEGPLLAVACCKHYAIYNVENIPAARERFNAVVGSRDLWETYMPVFEACVERGRGQSVMCSYNSVNGIPTCASKGLLTDALRTTMKFDGFVMSDYDAWENIVSTHHYVDSWADAATVALEAGLDQEGGGGPTYPPVQVGIPLALAAGNISTQQLTTAVKRLLRSRLRLGMFDPPALLPYQNIDRTAVASPAHLELAEKAAREGMTLFINKMVGTTPALPLKLSSMKKVAVLGPNANASYILLGSYSDPHCCTAGIPTLLEEFSQRALAAGVSLTYSSGCADQNCADTSGFSAAATAASTADAVILALGMGNAQFNCAGASNRDDCEAEASDRRTCALPGLQPGLVSAIKSSLKPGSPLIGVLVHGGAFCIDPVTLSSFDALLDAWYPGMRGAAAISDALVGVFSPSGRSPVTWYASDASIPSNRGEMSPYPIDNVSPGITYRFYDPVPLSLPPPIFTFGWLPFSAAHSPPFIGPPWKLLLTPPFSLPHNTR